MITLLYYDHSCLLWSLFFIITLLYYDDYYLLWWGNISGSSVGVTKTRNGKRNGMENEMKRKICNVIYVYLHKKTLKINRKHVFISLNILKPYRIMNHNFKRSGNTFHCLSLVPWMWTQNKIVITWTFMLNKLM